MAYVVEQRKTANIQQITVSTDCVSIVLFQKIRIFMVLQNYDPMQVRPPGLTSLEVNVYYHVGLSSFFISAFKALHRIFICLFSCSKPTMVR